MYTIFRLVWVRWGRVSCALSTGSWKSLLIETPSPWDARCAWTSLPALRGFSRKRRTQRRRLFLINIEHAFSVRLSVRSLIVCVSRCRWVCTWFYYFGPYWVSVKTPLSGVTSHHCMSVLVLFIHVGKLCIEVTSSSKVAKLSENLCIGCGICVKVKE